jgi:hypothetical protein
MTTANPAVIRVPIFQLFINGAFAFFLFGRRYGATVTVSVKGPYL